MPTRASSELAKLLPGRVLTEEPERASFAHDTWPLTLARLRRGDRPAMPQAVVRPRSVADVATLLAWCSERGVGVVPAAGRSGVCGGVAFDDPSAVALDVGTLRGVEVAAGDLRATALAGTPGPQFESTLEAAGLTSGHYPQSLAISTVGGWLACRSAGQFSTRYGKAEDRLSGLDVVLPSGELVSLGPHPSTAAGPDLMRLFCGSEGTLGVIVRATLRVERRGARRVRALRFEGFAEGLDHVREVVQSGLRPAVVRLYDPDDTSFSFPGRDGSLLVAVFEGPLAEAEDEAFGRGAAADLGPGPAEHWLAHRFDAVETLRDVMRPDGPLGPNVIVDTMEVAGSWSDLEELYESVREALRPRALGVLCHASHAYPDGACLYFTFALQGPSEEGAEARYHEAWEAALGACLQANGTITHHHGVGRLRAGWLRRELGEGGWSLLTAVKRALDPAGIMNPGNLGL